MMTTEGKSPLFCVHYLSRTLHAECAAGILYSRWNDIPFHSRPCYLKDGHAKPQSAACLSRKLPTAQEMIAYRVNDEERLRRRFEIFGRK